MIIEKRRITKISEDASQLQGEFDLLVVALGYEKRSRAFAEQFKGRASKKIGIGFTHGHVLSYADNKAVLSRLGFKLEEFSDIDFQLWWPIFLASQISESGKSSVFKICVDVSSQTRLRIAVIIQSLMMVKPTVPVEICFVYSLAEFSPSEKEPETAKICGPVIPFFAGWAIDPEQSAAAIIGLGYEIERAIGACEYLEPSRRIVLLPQGRDTRFDKAVSVANRSLLRNVAESDRFQYRVDRPQSTFHLIESLTYGLLESNRVILLPFGPKLFALDCLLCASLFYPHVGVWRVSPDTSEKPKERNASGLFIDLAVVFSAKSA